MAKQQHGAPLFTRTAQPVSVPDMELQPSEKATLVALARIERALGTIARKLVSVSKAVDEYQIVGGYTGTSTATIEVQPQFDIINEQITSIFVTGPVSTAFTLQLGDRNWTLTTDTRGMAVIAPVGILLGRNDRRILTSATPGNWTLELMGNADERY